MKAVVMAGGQGSRLRPLTAELPKPMLKVCGRPLLEYIFELLADAGVDEAWVTLQYKPTAITNHFRSGSFAGIKLNFVTEQVPLGTAGGVKNAVGAVDDDFIVISGDALCDIDLASAVEHHRRKGAEATIITRKVEDPREYGLADMDAEGQVRGFVEKPGWQDAFTDVVNTGIYIISGLCCKNIPDGFCDFAKDVFPALVKNKTLYAYRAEGYWTDIGDPGSYMRAQRDVLAGKVKCRIAGEMFGGCYFKDKKPEGNFVMEAPCYIGSGVVIGDGAIIGQNSVIEDGAHIGARARTSGSLIMQGASLGESSLTRNCIVCTLGGVGRNATAAAGSVIGPRSLLGDDAVLGEDVVLSEFEVVPDETIVVETPGQEQAAPPVLGDDCLVGRLGSSITLQMCISLGQSLAGIYGGKPICVADDGMNVSYIHKQALVCGILSCGGQVYDTGVMFGGQLRFSAEESGCEMGVLVGGYGLGIKFVFVSGGMPKALAKELAQIISQPSHPSCSEVVRMPEIMSGIAALWENRLVGSLISRRIEFAGSFACRNTVVAETAAKIFMGLGGTSDKSVLFSFSPDGGSVEVKQEGRTVATNEQLMAVCAAADFERGCDIIVPQGAPRVLEKIAAMHGRRVFRQPYCPETVIWSNDAVSLLMYAVSCTGTLERLLEALAGLPGMGVYVKEVKTDSSSAAILGEMIGRGDCVRQERGVTLKSDDGWVTVTPSCDGKSVNVLTEAASVEAAQELCGGFEEWIFGGRGN